MKLAKRIFSAVLAIAFTMTLVFADFNAIDSQAGSTKTVKSSVVLDFRNPTYKKAPVIKKGSTKMVANRDSALFCFTAPATKSYTFTFTNLVEKGKPTTEGTVGYVSCFVQDPTGGLDYKTISTKGGKLHTVWLCNKAGEKYHKKTKMVERCIPKRSAKVKLKKGQKIYFSLSVGLDGRGSVNVTVK